MRVHNVTYLIKEGGRNILSNKLMSFACIGVLVACFLLIGSAVLISLTVNNVVEYVENQNEVVAFLDENADSSDIDVVGLALKNLPNVAQVTFVSKEDSMDNLKIQSGSNSHLFTGLEGENNPLLHSFVIQVKELRELDLTVEQIRAIEGIFKVNAQTEIAAILSGLKSTVNYAGLGIVLILVAVSIVIITNTIKLTVFSRRKEINIMKYVGATDSFIRMPFLVEGMLIGLLAAVFAFVILGGAYTYFLGWVGEQYSQYISVILASAVLFEDVAVYIFAGFAAIGIFIGTIGSGMFVRRYLKV